MAKREATAADVAARAGVSRTAVSFVLNGKAPGNIAPETRDRILAAAEELGYSPHPVARSLRTRRTHVIGMITDAIASSPFGGKVLSGASERAREHGYLVTTFDSGGDPGLEEEAARHLQQRRVDGLLYAAMSLQEVETVPSVGLSVALANCWLAGDERPAVIPDEAGAGEAAATYLLSHGHRRIGVIIGSANVAGPLRLKGFRKGLSSSGVKPLVGRLRQEWTIDEGYAATVQLLAGTDRPTAIFCVNDRVATGALLAAAQLGLKVPNDLSIMGFDDQEELAPNLVPALTTMALPHREMGQRAVELLLAQIEGISAAPTPTLRQMLECPLVERESVGPAPR